MEAIRLSVHSVIDVITNSSSEMFMLTTEDTIPNVKSIVATILKACGSDKKVDDLYEVKLELEDRTIDRIVEFILDKPVLVLRESTVTREEVEAIVAKMQKEGTLKYFVEEHSIFEEYGAWNSSLVITPKVPEAKDFAAALRNVFDPQERQR